MSTRWKILCVLFAARAAMAFQYQSVAAISPLMMDHFAVGLAEAGLIFGLYLSPGIVMALPGGVLGQRFGERQVVAVGLVLMALGGAMMALGDSWGLHVAGRVVAGTGGVFLNVLMTKMVADWFAGREIATAMAVFVNSWPAGIALALVVMPWVAGATGYLGAMWVVSLVAAAGLVIFVLGYRDPESTGAPPRRDWPTGPVLAAVVAAGSVWGLYNAALAMVFGFGPAVLTERGMDLAAASAATSVVLWLAAVSIPLGGLLADRIGRPGPVVLAGLVAFAFGLMLARGPVDPLLSMSLVGLAAGLPAGPIMSLPGRVLPPGAAATGMGLFFLIYYAIMMAAPFAVGWLAERAGSAGLAFDAGIGMLVLAAIGLGIYWRAAGR